MRFLFEESIQSHSESSTVYFLSNGLLLVLSLYVLDFLSVFYSAKLSGRALLLVSVERNRLNLEIDSLIITDKLCVS